MIRTVIFDAEMALYSPQLQDIPNLTRRALDKLRDKGIRIICWQKREGSWNDYLFRSLSDEMIYGDESVEQLQEQLQIPASDWLVIAASNMLKPLCRAAGLCAALKNADCQIIEEADYQCHKAIEDGAVYEALHDLGVIEEPERDIRIIFFDIDHTTFDHSIFDVRCSTIKALQKLKDRDIRTFICTSRASEETVNVPKKLTDRMDGMICLAGAEVRIGSEVLYRELDYEEAQAGIALLDQNDIVYRYVTDQGRCYLNRRDLNVEAVFMRLYHMCPPVKPYEGEHVIHILYYGDAAFSRKLSAVMPHCVNCNMTNASEMMPEGTDKGRRMLEVANMLGFRREQVAAFGDDGNDVSMMRLAGLGIAMGNGSLACRNAADHVTEDISEEGLYNALIKYGIIDES